MCLEPWYMQLKWGEAHFGFNWASVKHVLDFHVTTDIVMIQIIITDQGKVRTNKQHYSTSHLGAKHKLSVNERYAHILNMEILFKNLFATKPRFVYYFWDKIAFFFLNFHRWIRSRVKDFSFLGTLFHESFKVEFNRMSSFLNMKMNWQMF